MKLNKWAVVLAGLFSAFAVTAKAQTVEIDLGGSAEVVNFINSIPVNVFLPNSTAPINHYVNGDIPAPLTISSGRLHVWTGTLDGAKVPGLGGRPAIIRYAASTSSDAFKLLQTQTTPPALTVPQAPFTTTGTTPNATNFLNAPADITGCSSLTAVVVGGVTVYSQATGCTAVTPLPFHLGLSLVVGSDFHQVGPSIPLTKATPLFSTLLVDSIIAVTPSKIVLGDSVKDTGGNPITNLTNTQVEAVISGSVTDWGTFKGFAAGPVARCLRKAGSGVKAVFNETQMYAAGGQTATGETTAGTTDLTSTTAVTLFGGTTQDVVDCLVGEPGLSRPAHPRGIAYIDYDQHAVGFHDATVDDVGVSDGVDSKGNLKNGLYPFWTYAHGFRRPVGSTGVSSDQDTLITGFLATASTPSVINSIPGVGQYWTAVSEMCVSKAATQGPITWISPAPTGCPAP